MKTILNNLLLIISIPLLFGIQSFSQNTNCIFPDEAFSTKENSIDGINVKTTNYSTANESNNIYKCVGNTNVQSQTVLHNGLKVDLQSDSINFDLTAVKMTDNTILYKFENIDSAWVYITDENGVVQHRKNHLNDQEDFEIVTIDDNTEKKYYLSAIVNESETIAMQIINEK